MNYGIVMFISPRRLSTLLGHPLGEEMFVTKSTKPLFCHARAASFAGFVFRNLGDMNSEIQRQAGVTESKCEDSRPLSGRGF